MKLATMKGRVPLAMLLVGLAACREEAQVAAPAKPAAPVQGAATEGRRAALVVSAAASTAEAMNSLCGKFGDDAGVDVKVNLGPTNGLATQILEGAPADLFLSASREWADKIVSGGQAAENVDLLSNKLVIVVPAENPAGVEKPEDLLSDKVTHLALAGEEVPAGKYAGQALTKLELLPKLADAKKVVRGQDVRGTLGYVERGEAEAGIVYATDALAAKGVKQVYEFDPALHERIVYTLVLLKHGADNPAARKLYEFLQSPDAEAVTRKLGFTRIP